MSHTERQSASGPSGPSGAPSTSLADMSSIGHAAWGLWWSHGAPSATMLGDVPTGALSRFMHRSSQELDARTHVGFAASSGGCGASQVQAQHFIALVM